MQNITTGNLYLNLTFDTYEGNLTVKAEINADSYDSNAVLALQFDSDNNGTIDIRYWPEYDYYSYEFWRDDLQFLLRANNKTTPSSSDYWGWFPNGTIYFSRILPMSQPYLIESLFHRCLYDGTKRLYTFFFTFPIEPTFFSKWGDEYGIQGNLVRVSFCIEPSGSREKPERGMAVYVPPFNFMERG
jgi:hypothetical protein